MEEDKDAVNVEESAASESQEQVNDQTEQTAEQPAAQEQTEITETKPQPVHDLDERGVPWKNRAMEAERKFQTEIPNVIRQTVEELNKTQQKQPEYTVEQLEQFAIENPNQRPWVEAQKHQLFQKNMMTALDVKLQAKDQQTRDESIRVQSEQWVTSHPKFKECFVDVGGAKQWNHSNPLTHVIGNYLNQVDPSTGRLVKDRADGLIVAAKMAYADQALNLDAKSSTQAAQLKKDLRKAQKGQMMGGAGTQATSGQSKTEVRKSLDNYNKTYDKSDISRATKAFLIASGHIKED